MVRDFFYHRLGKVIIRIRAKRGLTQEQTALLCDINRSHFARIEEGRVNPSIKTLNKIARVLRIKICYMLKGF